MSPRKLSAAKKHGGQESGNVQVQGRVQGLGQHCDLPRSSTLEKGKARVDKTRDGLGEPVRA